MLLIFAFWKINWHLAAESPLASYADALWARHAFLTHERLLQRELTSVHRDGPITGRLPFFGKREFDPYFHFAQTDDSNA